MINKNGEQEIYLILNKFSDPERYEYKVVTLVETYKDYYKFRIDGTMITLTKKAFKELEHTTNNLRTFIINERYVYRNITAYKYDVFFDNPLISLVK